MELEVLRFVDHPHTTTADLLDDAIMGNRLADQCSGILARHEMPGKLCRFIQRPLKANAVGAGFMPAFKRHQRILLAVLERGHKARHKARGYEHS